MKKLTSLGLGLLPLLNPMNVFAAEDNFIMISAPPQGYKTLGSFISNVLTVIFGIAVIAVLIMLVWGALEWITSGGDKDAVAKARNKILNALIGLAVLAVAFAVARVAGQFTGINIFNIVIPSPTTGPGS